VICACIERRISAGGVKILDFVASTLTPQFIAASSIAETTLD